MKTNILLIALSFTLNAVAASAAESDMIPLGTLNASSAYQVENNVANVIRGDVLFSQYKAGETAIESDLEFNCKKVSISYRNVDTYKGKSTDCQITFSCLPRSFKQKQILSLQRSCLKEAKEDCFKKEFLDYLDELESTKFGYINKTECSRMFHSRLVIDG